MEKDTSCKWKRKKAGIAMLLPDKMDFKTKPTGGDKEVYYLMIKGAI